MSDDMGKRQDSPSPKRNHGGPPRSVRFDVDLPSRGDAAEPESTRGVKRRGTPYAKGRSEGDVSEMLEGGLPPPPKFNKYGVGRTVGIPPPPQEHDPRKSLENDCEKEEASAAANNNNHRDEGTRGHDDDEEEEALVEDQAPNEEQAQGETEEEKAWKAFADKKKADGTACYSLTRFLSEGERWEGASQKLGAEHQKFNENMNEKIEGFLKFINDIFKNEHQKLDELEKGCKALLIKNHRKREAFVDRLHKSNETWKDNYESLLAQTMDEDEEEDSSAESKEADQQSEKGEETPNNIQDDDDELPAEVVEDANPKRAEAVERYLKAENRLHLAKEKFEGILNGTREELHAKVAYLLVMVENIHEAQANQIAGVESDIQSTMMSNHHRGEQIAQQAKAAEQRRKTFFGNMLQRVTSKVNNATRMMTDSRSK